MATTAVAEQKLYLYALTSELDDQPLGLIGLDEGRVYPITKHHVSAVVSHVVERLRPERRHLAAHQRVLASLMASGAAVLPVSFGIVADNEDAVRRILSLNARRLAENLGRVKGRVEMGLRVTWDVPNIFEYFVDTHPDLLDARDRFLLGRGNPSPDDKIEVGRLFDTLLNDDRETHAEKIEEALQPHCVEIMRNKPRNEQEAVSLACLIDRTRQAEFERAVFECAQLFDNQYSFDYSGPWAPHNFVDVALELSPPRRASARK
jgi:hypothetical protein